MGRDEITRKSRWKRTTSGRTKIVYKRGKSAKLECALCAGKLHGVPHCRTVSGISKLPKSQKRPEVLFGGVLCGRCREEVTRKAVLVHEGKEDILGISLKKAKFVEEVAKKVS
jgi:large subunit ribosomal protein L34e